MATRDTRQAILETIAYFDIFDYPVTPLEARRHCYKPDESFSLSRCVATLDELVNTHHLETRHGFYFFPGRHDIVATRMQRYQESWNKFALAQRASQLIRAVVGVRFVGICNNTSYHNATPTSDIDVFIIVSHGRLWGTRLLITMLMSMLRLRRHGRAIANRICLSFYVTDHHLDLADIALAPEDPYLVYWIATLYPLYDDGVYNEFLAANAWWHNLLPLAEPVRPTTQWSVLLSPFSVKSIALQRKIIGPRFEQWSKRVQYGKMQHNTQSALHQHSKSVIVDDTMLKFHETDRRARYANEWRTRMNTHSV